MLFDEQIMRRITNPQTYRRGVAYYLEGAVRDVTVKRLGNGGITVVGRVLGSKEYRVKLLFAPDASKIDFYDCTCPFDWDGPCKHVVALGLAAETQSADVEARDPEERISEVLRAFAKKRDLALSDADLRRLSRKLMQANAFLPKAVSPARPAIRMQRHSLDRPFLRLSYDRKRDVVKIEPFAAYGPLTVPLCSRDPRYDALILREARVTHVADRLLEAEEALLRELLAVLPLFSYLDVGCLGIFEERIYAFIKTSLPKLADVFEIEMDSSMQPLLEMRSAEVESTWKTASQAGSDWFDFSVEWQCRNAKLSSKELERLVRDGKPFVRDENGAFIEIANVAEMERVLEFVDRAKRKKDGTYASKLFRVPEMAGLLERSKTSRFVEMEGAFAQFLREQKTGKPIEPLVFPPSLDAVLRPYQKDGVAWAMFLRKYHFGGILADDMGLGKTLQVLALLSMTRSQAQYPSLVVCPKTLILTWMAEATKFTPELRMVAIDGTAAERKRRMRDLSAADVVVTSYALIQRDAEAYLKSGLRFDYVILDEAQYVKNAASVSAKLVKALPSSHRLAITGTPLENGVHELWSVFDFLMPGFLDDAKTFRTIFERPIRERQDQETLERLRRKILPFMLRRDKRTYLTDLPPKIEQTSPCALSPEQLVIYTRTLEQVRHDVFRTVKTKGFSRSKIEILSALMKLRRICDHPSLADARLPRSEELSGKMALALELVREAVSGGHKVLLFSQFASMLDILRDSLDRHGIGHCTIEGKTRDRGEQIRRFCQDPSVSVFLLSLKAGGTGLTLTEADTVILFDPWWNPQAERQAMDRAHRIGQTKTVNVYKLVAKGTVEEKVVALQARKQKVFDAIMQENAEAVETLTWEDVKDLFA